jgi:hypothetical protein
MKSLSLTIERSADDSLWGSVLYEDDLLVDNAKSVEALERQFKKLLHDFHDVDPKSVSFEHAYDLTSLFTNYNFLNISAIAEKAGINPSLMRQYASGVKKTSPETATKIEKTIHDIARDLLTVKVGSSIREQRRRGKPFRPPVRKKRETA